MDHTNPDSIWRRQDAELPADDAPEPTMAPRGARPEHSGTASADDPREAGDASHVDEPWAAEPEPRPPAAPPLDAAPAAGAAPSELASAERYTSSPAGPSAPGAPSTGDLPRHPLPAVPRSGVDEPWPGPGTLPPLDHGRRQAGSLFPPPPERNAPRPLYGYPIYDDPATAPEPAREGRRRGGWLLAVLAGLVGAASTVGALYALGALDRQEVVVAPPPTTAVTVPATVLEIREIVTEGDPSAVAVAVAEKVVPSIVTVEVGSTPTTGDVQAVGSGSGVVVNDDGLIVTNHHVVEDTDETRVVFQDGRIYQAEVIGSDRLSDLAVLRIEAVGLRPIEFGATDGLSIGDRAIAVGNPLGLRGGASLTVGVVSAFDREVRVGADDFLFGMLQTDAPITQGSSGGALVDGTGKLIGITTAIGVSSAGAEGIGFAIPVEVVTRITDEIIATGQVRHAFLGVQLQDSFRTQADGAMIPDGAIITGYAGDDSAARLGGLEVGDRIIRFGATPVETRDDLINSIRRLRVGDPVEVEVMRGGERVVTEVTLGERPPEL